jgi:hypothetical protein
MLHQQRNVLFSNCKDLEIYEDRNRWREWEISATGQVDLDIRVKLLDLSINLLLDISKANLGISKASDMTYFKSVFQLDIMSTDLTLEFHGNRIRILVNTTANGETSGKACRETLLKDVLSGVQRFSWHGRKLTKKGGQREGKPAP